MASLPRDSRGRSARRQRRRRGEELLRGYFQRRRWRHPRAGVRRVAVGGESWWRWRRLIASHQHPPLVQRGSQRGNSVPRRAMRHGRLVLLVVAGVASRQLRSLRIRLWAQRCLGGCDARHAGSGGRRLWRRRWQPRAQRERATAAAGGAAPPRGRCILRGRRRRGGGGGCGYPAGRARQQAATAPSAAVDAAAVHVVFTAPIVRRCDPAHCEHEQARGAWTAGGAGAEPGRLIGVCVGVRELSANIGGATLVFP